MLPRWQALPPESPGPPRDKRRPAGRGERIADSRFAAEPEPWHPRLTVGFVSGCDLAQRQDATAIHHDQSLVAPGVEVRYLKRAIWRSSPRLKPMPAKPSRTARPSRTPARMRTTRRQEPTTPSTALDQVTEVSLTLMPTRTTCTEPPAGMRER